MALHYIILDASILYHSIADYIVSYTIVTTIIINTATNTITHIIISIIIIIIIMYQYVIIISATLLL